MVYIKDWPEFQQRSIKLYTQSPHKTRYLIKSRPSQHSLTLKVTDDVTTIKYRTKSSAILGRLEVFNKAMMFAMAGSSRPLQEAEPAPVAPVAAAAAVAKESATASVAGGAAPGQASTPAAGGAGAGTGSSDKKKKKKKGKK